MKKTAEPLADQLLNWLMENKATIKAGGIAKSAGVDISTISRWMLGKAMPTDSSITKLAEAAEPYGFKAVE